MSLASKLFDGHPEPQLTYTPMTGFISAGMQLSNERKPTWMKMDGVPMRIDVPVFEATEASEIGDLGALWRWAGDADTFPEGEPELTCEVPFDTPQEIMHCAICDGSGSQGPRACHCTHSGKNDADPRCTRCKGTGSYESGCYYCHSSGQHPLVFHLEILDETGTRRIAIKPQAMAPLAEQLPEGGTWRNRIECSPLAYGWAFKAQDSLERWHDALSLQVSMRRPTAPSAKALERFTQAQLEANSYGQMIYTLRYLAGVTSPETPYRILARPIDSERESMARIVAACNELRLGCMVANREGVMGTGESGWSVQAMSKAGMREIAAWYQLPLALMNGAEYFQGLIDKRKQSL